MAYIIEETEHEVFEIRIQVLEKNDQEIKNSEPGTIIQVEWDHHERLTAKELESVGRWFVNHATRIKKEYTSKGKRKVHGNSVEFIRK